MQLLILMGLSNMLKVLSDTVRPTSPRGGRPGYSLTESNQAFFYSPGGPFTGN